MDHENLVAGQVRAALSEPIEPTEGFDFWRSFASELDQWARSGRTATFWWRDDDAVEPSERLERLVGLSDTYRVPFALSVVPAAVSPRLAPFLRACTHVAAIQHGFAHTNHAPHGQGLGAWELGLHRPEHRVLKELALGRDRLSASFGARFLPVVAAPWNRVDAGLFPGLARLGFVGVSASGTRSRPEPVAGLRVANIHCDLLKWHNGQGRFRSAHKVYQELVAHLRLRRRRIVDPDEPTGLLTHHLDFDEAAWRFFERFIAAVEAHPASCWVSPGELFLSARPRSGG